MIVYALSLKNLFYSFLALYLFGAFFGVCLLNILSHKKFFFIGREIEKEEMKKEKRLLNKHLHHGKIAATFIIGVIGGPVFSAITTRILLNNFSFKYLVILFSNVFATLITMGAVSGFIRLVNIR